jgi:hypothetical protein
MPEHEIEVLIGKEEMSLTPPVLPILNEKAWDAYRKIDAWRLRYTTMARGTPRQNMLDTCLQ